MKKLILLFLFLTLPALAQKRYLVSPYGDAIPIGKDQGAAEILKSQLSRKATSTPMVCTNRATFGWTIDQYTAPGTNHIGFHQDVMAMWYVAPASGTIDTVFWRATDVGSLDSTITLRLFNSNIYPGSGPGYGGYPAPSQTTCWGYFVNTNDADNGVAPFTEEATDTTWFSTVSGGNPSFNPMGPELWGFGGVPVQEDANAVNFYDLGTLGAPSVTVGDPFFITIRIYGPHEDQSTEDQTGFLAQNETNPLSTHNWKFYEHVATIQPGFTCVGWVARGGFHLLFWYSMTVTTNIPPTFSDVTTLGNTLSTGNRVVQATIVDCNPGDPGSAGVDHASIRYSVNGVAQSDVAMAFIGGDTWEAQIPGASVDDVITYKIVAADSADFTDSTAGRSYKVVALSTEWYTADTGAACTVHDISSSGTSIPPASFFVPPYPGSGTAPMDDGTAGPFDMGANFTVFADTFRYAWIGVNGALALSKSPLDTLDVNSNGFANTFWDFPYAQKSGRGDTAGANNMPGMLIAPFWSDLIISDTATTYGRILYGNDGDPCLFIAQWDSIGAFDDAGAIADITTVRAVLNRCDGTVEFQYESVGTTGLDSLALVGMQADSNEVSGPEPGWIYVNAYLYPEETKPYDGSCVRFTPHIGTVAIDGWNIVSVSLTPNDANYSKASLFPTSVSPAYEYAGGYTPADPLVKGKGYWLKFNGDGGVGSSPGTFDTAVTAAVQDKWNLIGGTSGFVATSEIVPVGTTIASAYFGYSPGGYFTATTLQAGHGYWVKVLGSGTLDMTWTGAAAPKQSPAAADLSANRLSVKDASGRTQHLWLADESTLGNPPDFFELPPPPPAGGYDVRFSSQRMLESWRDDDAGARKFPVEIQGAAWPVTLSWEIGAPPSGTKRIFLEHGGESAATQIEGAGSLVLKDQASAAGLAVKISSDAAGIPTEFSLGRNYPNPFNPETHVQVDIASESDVEVAVYDLLGRKVSTLMSGPHAAGSVTLSWDGRDNAGTSVPTGMYVIRMKAGDFSASQKVLLMK